MQSSGNIKVSRTVCFTQWWKKQSPRPRWGVGGNRSGWEEEMAQMPQPEPVLPPAGQLCPCCRLNLVTSPLYHLSLSLESGDQHRICSEEEGARRSCREYAGITLWSTHLKDCVPDRDGWMKPLRVKNRTGKVNPLPPKARMYPKPTEMFIF